VRHRRCAIIALHTVVGIVLLSVPVVFLYGLLILNREPPPWLLEYRARINRAIPLARDLIRCAMVIPLLVAALAGLNLALGFHPLGIDYHRPWTYLSAIIPLLVVDFIGGCFNRKLSQPKELHSAVSDDWLLWDKPSDENAKASL
jgi:hypothetical protein